MPTASPVCDNVQTCRWEVIQRLPGVCQPAAAISWNRFPIFVLSFSGAPHGADGPLDGLRGEGRSF
jgi:hypothetical protein